ncbi:interferon-induced protein 44-like [Mercenaria mercenaria]|uniref:interferon-induced protein 44-like n=1 Tax=Mercenaria mercenaria TaxID=6596 RepID=UPI00234EAC10|nr:interferon-induced protein 44-like [Mercenaria mercenaria]
MSVTTILLAEVGAKISGGTNRKSFNLLYSASKTVDVDEFHVKCDAKGPTVTLLYGKFNTLFGGYTSKNWTSTDNQTKEDNAAFLFYKDESPGAICKFLPIKKGKAHKAVTCDASFGPTFGGGSKKKYDLQVFKKDIDAQPNDSGNFMHLNGTLKVGRAYEEEITDGIVGKKRDKTPDINSGKLIVARVEVYQVVDDELNDDWKWKPKDKDCNDMKTELIEMEQPGLNVKQYNILLVGVIGSGKSSFYNTLATIFSGKVTHPAVTRASPTSVTNKVENYDLKSENGTKLKIRITDIRGFEDKRGLTGELECLLNGKLPTDYQFTAKPGAFENDLRTNVTLNDEIHLVCFVSGNTNFDALPITLREHIDAIKEIINNKGLPTAVIVTKCDELCPLLSENVDHVYKCSKARDSVKKVAEFYGEAKTKVFPVVNYVDKEKTDIGIDRLAVQALHGMYKLVQAYLREHKGMKRKSDGWESRGTKVSDLCKPNAKEDVLMGLQQEMSKLQDRKLRVLLVGPVNAGKSSFIDLINKNIQRCRSLKKHCFDKQI